MQEKSDSDYPANEQQAVDDEAYGFQLFQDDEDWCHDCESPMDSCECPEEQWDDFDDYDEDDDLADL